MVHWELIWIRIPRELHGTSFSGGTGGKGATYAYGTVAQPNGGMGGSPTKGSSGETVGGNPGGATYNEGTRIGFAPNGTRWTISCNFEKF